MTKLTWSKRPSVTRPGKWFFTTQRNETRYLVIQPFAGDAWAVEDNHGAAWGKFSTANEAMRDCETRNG